MGWLSLTITVVCLAVALDRLLLAAERRGWIYYRTCRPPKGAAAERLTQLGTIWDPSQQHQLDQRDAEEDDLDEADDPDDL